MSLSELKAVLAAPAIPLAVPTEEDWAKLAEELGVEIPTDYREFVSQYGAGYIDDFLWILLPAEILRSLAETQDMEAALARRNGPSLYPGYSLHPHRPGLVPLGGTDNGNRIFWLTECPTPPWPIIVTAARDTRVDRFDVSFAQWLSALLRRELIVSVFPEDWPGEEPVFRPD